MSSLKSDISFVKFFFNINVLISFYKTKSCKDYVLDVNAGLAPLGHRSHLNHLCGYCYLDDDDDAHVGDDDDAHVDVDVDVDDAQQLPALYS